MGHGVHAAVRRAIAHLWERRAESIALDDLATHTALNKFHLCRAYLAQIGMPSHAPYAPPHLARDGAPRASELAARVGLHDQSQLTHHFSGASSE